jgi:hypothetical protein
MPSGDPRPQRRRGPPLEAAAVAASIAGLLASVGAGIGGTLVVGLPALVAMLGSGLFSTSAAETLKTSRSPLPCRIASTNSPGPLVAPPM